MIDRKRVFLQEDKLLEAVEWDPGLVDRLSMLSPVFKGLAVSGKSKEGFEGTSLADAARLAEIAPDAFVTFVNNVVATSEDKSIRPTWVEDLTEETATVVLDVRPIISQGEDPLGRIMEAMRPLNSGSRVILEVSFDPKPLKAVLGGMGFTNFAEQISAKHWRIYFCREYEMQSDVTETNQTPAPQGSLGEADLDVRGLEPPQPLVAILKRLQGGDVGDDLTVLIHREPIYLAPELNEIGWTFEIIASAPDGSGGDEFLLRLTKEDA